MSIKLSDKERCLFESAKKFALNNIYPYSDQWENGEKISFSRLLVFIFPTLTYQFRADDCGRPVTY